MANDSFTAFVLDQLAALPDLRKRAMFGAQGIYQDKLFFGILDEGRLFFRTDAASAIEYRARGMSPFTYTRPDKRVITFQYHEVPPEVLECAPELVAWAQRAIRVAAAAAPQSPVRKKR